MSKVTITESILTGIGNAIRAKLGGSAYYTPGQMPAAIASIPTSGGTNSITVSDDTPTAGDGEINDLWVVSKTVNASSLISRALTRTYTIQITEAARDTSYSFSYYGARELEFVFDDGNGNDVLLQDIGSFTWTGRLSKSTLFDKSLSSYAESSGLPATMTASLTVPAGYTLKGFRVGWRNDSSWKDFWRSFTLTESFDDSGTVYNRQVLNKSSMVYSQWNVGEYVDFSSDLVFPSSLKSDPVLYIKLAGGWTAISSLDEYLNHI